MSSTEGEHEQNEYKENPIKSLKEIANLITQN